MLYSKIVSILGFVLAVYIMAYVTFLIYLLLGSFKENKLIKKYGKKKDTCKIALWILAGGGFILGVVACYIFFNYA